MESSAAATRIAVIAIHGVGDHLPREMAEAAADLLESRGDYTAFEETDLRVDVAGVVTDPQHRYNVSSKAAWGPLDCLRLSGATVSRAEESKKDSIDHLFMEEQLKGFEPQGSEDVYECLRLDSRRKAGGATPEKLVHVYDMFWSNLSGVSQSGLRVFGELYQLLFHLGSVGVTNVAAAATFLGSLESSKADPKARSKAGKRWDAFAHWQRLAAGMLAFPIPLINLLALACAASIFVTAPFAALRTSAQIFVAAVLPVAGVTALLALGRFGIGGKSSFTYRAPLFLALIGVVAAAWCATRFAGWKAAPEAAQWIVAMAVFGAALVGAYAVVAAYDKRRPGAIKAAIIVFSIWVPVTAATCRARPPWAAHSDAIAAMLRGAEVGFWMLAVCWLLFLPLLAIAAFQGYLAVRSVRNSPIKELRGETGRAARTNWTARLTIALPGLVFLLVTFAAWLGLLHAALPLLWRDPSLDPAKFQTPAIKIETHCSNAADDTVCYSPLWTNGSKVQAARTWADECFFDAGVATLPVLFLLTALAAIIALYAVGPSVACEISPPDGDRPAPSIRLGNWLDLGFRFMRAAGRLMYLAVFLFTPLMIAVLGAKFAGNKVLWDYAERLEPLTATMGALIGGGAMGLLAFGGRLSKLALGLRTAVRVGLDVDNWLREHPRGTNPTVRICARYVSLLRHILNWRDAEGGYDALVIFAHSQGTVITADLLRFLNVEAHAAGGWRNYDSSLANLGSMNVYLLTCGCPLRQLYGLRFPYLYGYADDGSTISEDPKPKDLGVAHWFNGYRTGDYVGRFLWRSTDPWNPENPFRDGSREETAIGPGAHTHYWDKTGARIGEALDKIIAGASRKAPGNAAKRSAIIPGP